MADAQTDIDLDQLHDGIITAVAAQFPEMQTVADYEQSRAGFTAPACFIELTEFVQDFDNQPGTEQLQVIARFEAHLVIGFRTTTAKREIRKLAGSFAAFLHAQRWGFPVGECQFMGARPDELMGSGQFADNLDQYEVWTVEWEQALHLGNSVWVPGEDAPTEVYVGYAPNTGPDHVNEYMLIIGPDLVVPMGPLHPLASPLDLQTDPLAKPLYMRLQEQLG